MVVARVLAFVTVGFGIVGLGGLTRRGAWWSTFDSDRATLFKMTASRTAVPAELLPHLRRARDHIDTRYAQPLALDEVAAVAGVSKYHFVRCFASAYGQTPIRYLTQRRIERAQDLLRSANLTVTEVCTAVGFSSLGTFSLRFRQVVGETPTEYRNRWAAAGGPRVPGCYLFMCGVLNPGTTGPSRPADGPGNRRSAI